MIWKHNECGVEKRALKDAVLNVPYTWSRPFLHRYLPKLTVYEACTHISFNVQQQFDSPTLTLYKSLLLLFFILKLHLENSLVYVRHSRRKLPFRSICVVCNHLFSLLTFMSFFYTFIPQNNLTLYHWLSITLYPGI